MKLLKQQIRLRVALAILTGSLFVGLGFSLFYYFSVVAEQTRFAEKSIEQLIITVEETASIAVYLDNPELAQEVVRGLTKNDLVAAARIVSETGLNLSVGEKIVDTNNLQASDWLTFTLDSPFEKGRLAGHLLIFPDKQFIQSLAREAAIGRASGMIVLALFMAFLVYMLISMVLTIPLKTIAKDLNGIIPGSSDRVLCPSGHEQDEIGCLTRDVNYLLSSAETILNSERELRFKTETLEKRFRLIFEKASAGIILLDKNNQLITCNPAFRKLLTLDSEQELENTSVDVTRFFVQSQELLNFLDDLRNSEYQRMVAYDLQIKNKSCDDSCFEEERWLHCLFSKINDQEGEVIIEGLFYDITERTQREQLTRYEAEHDALTQLLNRRAGENMLFNGVLNATKNNSLFAIMLLDLDKFKPINDTYGHDAGDQVLIIIAKRLKNLLRQDDIVIRWGGDEFVVGLTIEENSDNIGMVAEKIINKISESIKLASGQMCHVGASIGIAYYPEHGSDLQGILDAADSVMYEAKESGRNTYRIYNHQ